jgi:hypothetical protein
MFAVFLQIWQRIDDRQQAFRSAVEYHEAKLTARAGHPLWFARHEAPADLPTTVRAPNRSEPLRVVIGVSHDPLDALIPRRVVLQAFDQLPGKRRGPIRLAELTVFVTDQGIRPIRKAFPIRDFAFGAAFLEYLETWREATGRALLFADMPTQFGRGEGRTSPRKTRASPEPPDGASGAGPTRLSRGDLVRDQPPHGEPGARASKPPLDEGRQP